MGIQERRRRERKTRRETILEAARTLITEQGLRNTTTREIAKRCELSEGTLFTYFRGKEEMFVALLFEAIDFMEEGLEDLLSSGQDGRERVRAMWSFFREVQDAHPEYFHVFSYLASPGSLDEVSEEVQRRLEKRSGDNFRRFARILEDTVSHPEPRLVADVLWASFFGLMVLRDSRRNLQAPLHPTSEELDRVLTQLWEGIG